MSVSYMEMIRGYPYKTPDGLAEEIHKSKRTVMRRMEDLKQEIKNGRYSGYSVIEDEGIILINVPVFLDFLKYRKVLADKNARKNIPDFRPEELAALCGWNSKIVNREASGLDKTTHDAIQKMVHQEIVKMGNSNCR